MIQPAVIISRASTSGPRVSAAKSKAVLLPGAAAGVPGELPPADPPGAACARRRRGT